MYKFLFVFLIFIIQPAWSHFSSESDQNRAVIFEDNKVVIDEEGFLKVAGSGQGTVVIERGGEIRPIVIDEQGFLKVEEGFLKVNGSEQGTVVIERE